MGIRSWREERSGEKVKGKDEGRSRELYTSVASRVEGARHTKLRARGPVPCFDVRVLSALSHSRFVPLSTGQPLFGSLPGLRRSSHLSSSPAHGSRPQISPPVWAVQQKSAASEFTYGSKISLLN